MSEYPEDQLTDARTADPGMILFPLLAIRGFGSVWASHADPVAGLAKECRSLASDPGFMEGLRGFLVNNPIIEASCESMLAQLAMAAGSRWEATAPVLHPLSRRGWHISRWLPTFLLISGPLGHLLRSNASPLCQRLRGKNSGLPILTDVRDIFNHDDFRLLRNGFGHWSFEWLDTPVPGVAVVEWETARRSVQLSILECEALHFVTVCAVEAISRHLFGR